MFINAAMQRTSLRTVKVAIISAISKKLLAILVAQKNVEKKKKVACVMYVGASTLK